MFDGDGYEGSGAQPPGDPLIAALEAAIDAIAADDPTNLDFDGQTARLRALSRSGDRLDAQRTRHLGVAESSGALAADGALTAAAWQRRHSNLTAGQAATRARVARLQQDLPVLAAAYAAGDIGITHMAHIVRLCDDAGYDNVAAVQEQLAAAAIRLRTVGEFTRYCAMWRHALRPDAADAADDHAWATRGLTLSPTIDGVMVISGNLDARAGAALATAVNAYSHPDPAGTPRELRRTAAQRRADALEAMANVALAASDAPTVAGARPRVTLRADVSHLDRPGDHDQPDKGVGHGSGGGQMGSPARSGRGTVRRGGRRVCLTPPTLDWMGPIGPRLAHEIISDSSITRILSLGASQTLDMGAATRVWPAGIRTAITDRDRGCRFDPCDRPAEWCDIDHIDPWTPEDPATGRGRTAVDNGILLCRVHHRAKRRDGWWPDLRRDGTVIWTHPDGRRRIDRPAHLIDGGYTTLPDATLPGLRNLTGEPSACYDAGPAPPGAGHPRQHQPPTYQADAA